MSPDALFDGWSGVIRVLVITPAAYVSLILVLRISGKRTLAKLNAFDFVVTIAIGSTLASIITSKSLALVEGLVALGLLVVLQYVVARLSVRFAWANSLFKAEPALLLRDGELMHKTMRRERITKDDIESAVRDAGSESLSDAQAVFLETDGSLSVIPRSK